MADLQVSGLGDSLRVTQRCVLLEQRRDWRVRKEFSIFGIQTLGTSLMAQWLRLCALSAGGLDLIPGLGTRSRMPN